MFTIAQIGAIIGLLLAFNAPQMEVEKVKAILEGNSVNQEAPGIGGVGGPIQPEEVGTATTTETKKGVYGPATDITPKPKQ